MLETKGLSVALYLYSHTMNKICLSYPDLCDCIYITQCKYKRCDKTAGDVSCCTW